MGNCQAVEVGTVLVELPGGRLEKIPCGTNIIANLTANHLMTLHPGYFVANPTPTCSELQLLPSGAPLRTGNCYKLVSFQEAFQHFAQGSTNDYSLTKSPAISDTTGSLASKHKKMHHYSSSSSLSSLSSLSSAKTTISKQRPARCLPRTTPSSSTSSSTTSSVGSVSTTFHKKVSLAPLYF